MKYKQAKLVLDTGHEFDKYNRVDIELDVDRQPAIYQLYSPEQINNIDDPNLYLWIRRCELFTSVDLVYDYFKKLGVNVSYTGVKHELFPELTIINDDRGHKWYLCKAKIHHG